MLAQTPYICYTWRGKLNKGRKKARAARVVSETTNAANQKGEHTHLRLLRTYFSYFCG